MADKKSKTNEPSGANADQLKAEAAAKEQQELQRMIAAEEEQKARAAAEAEQKSDTLAPNRHKVAAARAAAHLPRGYVGVVGFRAQEQFQQAVEGYGELSDIAAALLYDCAMANLHDKNRQGGPGVVINDLKRQMEFITGDNKAEADAKSIGVVSIEPAPETSNDPEGRAAVNVI